MAQAVEVIVERESANDTDGTVVEIFFATGMAVTEGERIFDVETSKAVQEICAPASGILVHALKQGDTIQLGGAIARIVSDPSDLVVSPVAAEQPSRAVPVRESLPRLSREAAVLAARHGLGAADFDLDLVTSADVRRHLGLEARPLASEAPPSAPAASLPPGVNPIANHKRDEIAFLSRGAGASMLSVLGAVIGHGDLVRPDEGFFETKITDIVAFEASRLMADHPKMNAAWRDGGIELHGHVNAGVAFDNDGRLLVYGIENADALDLPDLQDEILEGFRRYARNKLTLKELTRATFTITDLSATGVDYVLPLLPAGQSCIIGITNGERDGFALYLGFDHRVTEGLAASRFLMALRDRVRAAVADLYQPAQCCAFCDAPLPAAGGKGLLQVVDTSGRRVLCCRRCWAEG